MPPALLGKPIAAIGGVVLADRAAKTGGVGSTQLSRLRIKRADPIYQSDTDISEKLAGR
ncbi:hypothetical protein L2449_28420 [Mesorhizobium muleiense]|uniref:hypothetical protein n=1 Tax=Mesorhizobium muleiense TaxID=1004279 RepID=UPI001F490F3E|nr:hypothetical protein [Mesorhizobium muleiense]MCF6120753.1 hypothetical protein [Mesorhizobium muleiense]